MKLSRYDSARNVVFGIVAILGIALLIAAFTVSNVDAVLAARTTIAAFGFAGAIFSASQIERILDRAKKNAEIRQQQEGRHTFVAETVANVIDYLIERGGNK